MIHKFKGKVKLFPQQGGWFYVRVPPKVMKEVTFIPVRGLVPIKVTLGDSTWDTSLLPMGDGTHFIALKASIRKKYHIDLGKTVSLSFTVR